MSRAPHLLTDLRFVRKFGSRQLLDALLHDGLWCATEQVAMGELAEATARAHRVTREAQDAFAVESHRRAAEAIARGDFKREIVAVPGSARNTLVEVDEGPRGNTSLESLGTLTPAFQADGTVTAGNSSQLSDGAAAVMVRERSDRGASSHSVEGPHRCFGGHGSGSEGFVYRSG